MSVFISNGAHLTYRVDGPDDAPVIILVNSLGTNLRMWDPQVALLSRTLRVVRFDCRGHRTSDVPPGPYTIAQFGLDLLTLLDTLQIARAHICGLSLGGMIALWFVSHYPERVMNAVFANTAARIGTTETWNTRIEAVRTGGMAAVRDAVLARFLSEGFRQRHPEVAQQISAMIETTNPAGYIGACAALRDADLHERLVAIHVPSLIIAGELDESTPPSQSRELHTAIAGSQLVIFPETAHLSNVEQSERFNQCILAFLDHADGKSII